MIVPYYFLFELMLEIQDCADETYGYNAGTGMSMQEAIQICSLSIQYSISQVLETVQVAIATV
jgi:hypothetical protein